MNENLYIAHKKLPHKTLRVHSALGSGCDEYNMVIYYFGGFMYTVLCMCLWGCGVGWGLCARNTK